MKTKLTRESTPKNKSSLELAIEEMENEECIEFDSFEEFEADLEQIAQEVRDEV